MSIRMRIAQLLGGIFEAMVSGAGAALVPVPVASRGGRGRSKTRNIGRSFDV